MNTSNTIKQISPDTLEIKSGGGCLSVFGLPFLGAGIFILLVALDVVPLSNESNLEWWAHPLLFVMGTIFAGVGGGLVFGRKWIIIDKATNKITKVWGLIIPMKREELNLSDYNSVAIKFTRGDSDSADQYPIALSSNSNNKEFPLSSFIDYGDARKQAVTIAEFLKIPLSDESTGHKTVVEAEQAGVALRNRLWEKSSIVESVSRPYQMVCKVEEMSHSAKITIPGPRLRLVNFAPALIPIGILIYFGPRVMEFFDKTKTPVGFQKLFTLAGIMFLGVLPVVTVINKIIGSMRSATIITADSSGISIDEKSAWKTKTSRLPADTIWDIDYGTVKSSKEALENMTADIVQRNGYKKTAPLDKDSFFGRMLLSLSKLAKSEGISIKHSSGIYNLGAWLSDDEIRYLHYLLLRGLRGERPPVVTASKVSLQ
jgi:hypothetical protein